MALPQFELGKKPDDAKYSLMNLTAGGAGIDPNILRLLARQRRQQGLAGPRSEPTQRAPQQASGFRVQSQPIDPRLRAALMLRQKIQQQQGASADPRYAGPYGRKGA